MPMSPHPTFDFSKVVDHPGHAHSSTIPSRSLVSAWVQGQIADAEAHASAYAPDSVSQNSHGRKIRPFAHQAYSEFISATNGAYANWIA